MILVCPDCEKKLRINTATYAGKKLSLTCRHCGQNFPCLVPNASKFLVAHGEPDVCRTIQKICRGDLGEIQTCSDAQMARQLLDRQIFTALLLDVALPGAFPFQLIDEIHRSGDPTIIVLLPSVYNRTAYKRKPSSLYGADGYIELHHLSDRLIPLLHELLPSLAGENCPLPVNVDIGAERSLLLDADTHQQAEELARLFIADIALYHQEQIDLGIQYQDLEKRLTFELDEGRRMLACRIPQVALETKGYLLSALQKFADAREKELLINRESAHG
jgi:CheY-like chemotaxis protein